MTYVKKPTWTHYSPKLTSRILNPRASGEISEEPEGMRLIEEVQGSYEEGAFVKLTLLIDLDDGQIADAKYVAFGESALIGALEVMCELTLRKNYDQAKRISADLIDTHVQGKNKKSAFPPEVYSQINFALAVLDTALEKCSDIALPEGYVATPVSLDDLEEGELPDWDALEESERLSTIRAVIQNDIQPYVELDDGGVTVTELKGDFNVMIQYSGTCTSCYAATGSTLSAIQAILRKRVHPELTVTPDL